VLAGSITKQLNFSSQQPICDNQVDEVDGSLCSESKSDRHLHQFIEPSGSTCSDVQHKQSFQQNQDDVTNLELNRGSTEISELTFNQPSHMLSEEFSQCEISARRTTGNYELCTELNDKSWSSTSGSQKYTTSMYIDSLAPALNVPLQEKTEVLLLLKNSLSFTSETDAFCGEILAGERKPSRYQTVLNADVIENFDGQLVLSPVSCKTMTVTVGHSEQHCPNASVSQEVDYQPVNRRISFNAIDTTDHQILHSIIQQSAFLSVSLNFFVYLTPMYDCMTEIWL
jgi:hypothetical protein